MRNSLFQFIYVLLVWPGIPCPAFSAVSWDDIFYSSGPYKGSSKIWWSKMTEEQRAYYLERYRDEISYCLQNLGKNPKEVDQSKGCCAGSAGCEYAPISYYTISAKYFEYRDYQKGAEYSYRFWLNSPEAEIWDGEAPMHGLDVVITGYETAGMYQEVLPFYQKSYSRLMEQLSASTDIKLLKADFKAYKEKWPELAEDYHRFTRDWDKAKILAKTVKPKPLDPAVQHHEWFYSAKQEEVLRALAYYHQHRVRFMLEKALKHKDPVVAAKAKEYLENLVKDVTGDETKK